ncbi:MAG: MFS transporter [Burkholderiaceae bacterium]|nr:MFS transporter [Burkholderiaceae bacterium]MCX7902557.1 MFS transporter [Burkholderiaceae bacterium]
MPSSDPLSSRELRASAVLAAVYGLRMFGLFLILPVFAVHARALPGGEDALVVGLALGIYGLTQGLLQLPFGLASDRFGRRPVIVAGLALLAAGSLCAAFASNLWGVIIGRAMQGAGAIAAAVTALVADVTREQHRGTAMAMIGASIGLAFALALVVAPPLYGAIGMRGLFLLTAALAMAAIVAVLRLPPLPPPAAPSGVVRWPAVLLDRDLLRLHVGIFVLHAVQTALFVAVPTLLVARGLPLAQHGWLYLLLVLAAFALMLPPLRAAQRRARLRALLVGAILLLAAVQLGLAWVAPNLAALALWLLLFFVAFNILEASLPTLLSWLAPPAHRGAALGVYNTMQSLGLFVGGALGGTLARGFGLAALFSAAAGVLLLWAILALGMREPPRRGAMALDLAA